MDTEWLLFTDYQDKLKINREKQPDRPSHMGWTVPREGKILWKTTTQFKVLFT